MVMHPGPDREFADWAKAKKLRWIGVDCGSADHPMNTIIRDWMPRQARQAEKVFKKKYGKPLAEYFDDSKYQLMHLEMFPFGIVHAECIGGEIDLLLNRRVTIGFFPWRFVDGDKHRALRGGGDDANMPLMHKRSCRKRASATPMIRRTSGSTAQPENLG
jgi:kynurenine formamidase